MSKDNSTISFDFLGSFWNITSYPTSHALSDGIISGALRRYQDAPLLSSRLQAVCLVTWTRHHSRKQALPADFHERRGDIQYCPTVTLNF